VLELVRVDLPWMVHLARIISDRQQDASFRTTGPGADSPNLDLNRRLNFSQTRAGGFFAETSNE
jgi:hypothetical protein